MHSNAVALCQPHSSGPQCPDASELNQPSPHTNKMRYERTSSTVHSGPETPDTCRVTGMHLLHRHGARYPSAWGLSSRLNAATSKWTASGKLNVLNECTGHRARMLASAQNFAIGFFGYPFEGQYQQRITIEGHGVHSSKADRGRGYLAKWASVYLKKALRRLQPQLTGYTLTIEDVYVFQQLCAYETVALGYSKFCELFIEEEWDGFEYSFDLYFSYNSGFGFPLARSQGIGYVQELVARLTHTPISTHNSSTHATLDDNLITFPFGQSLYVDATHKVVVLNVLTALNLSTLATEGSLPADHIPKHPMFRVSQLPPFATNVQFQRMSYYTDTYVDTVLECTSVPGPQIHIIVNDGVVPLTGIAGCAAQKDGMCAVDAFVAAQKEIIGATDWAYDCYGNWTIPDGWETTTGEPPRS
ncbi:phytase [Mycena leptocephala]|nr:phytase [Mycena leptocephala]